jgi:hypothetical protein
MRLFDELAQRFAARNSGPQFANTGALSASLNERTRALQHNVGALLYLISLGVVAVAATVVVFFGLGFLLLAHPNEEMIAGTHARDHGAEVEPQRADLVPSPDKDAAPSTTQTASALSVSPAAPEPHYDVLPRATEDTAPGSAIAARGWRTRHSVRRPVVTALPSIDCPGREIIGTRQSVIRYWHRQRSPPLG